MRQFKQVLAVLAVLGWVTAAGAQELKIGLSAEPSAMDPHFHNLTPNNSLTKHIFDRLTDQDENQLVQPALALSWRTTDDTTGNQALCLG
jgi:peptide/nickel transport system substrate-binding protein